MKFGADGTMQRRAFFLLGNVALALALSGCPHDSKPVQYYRLSVDSGNIPAGCARQETAGGRVCAGKYTGNSAPPARRRFHHLD